MPAFAYRARGVFSLMLSFARNSSESGTSMKGKDIITLAIALRVAGLCFTRHEGAALHIRSGT